jgi:hypothetical protein
MSLRWSLNMFDAIFYKYAAPMALSSRDVFPNGSREISFQVA